MSLRAIHDAIPHRAPFLFVDEIVEQGETRIVCTKRFTGEEFFFAGHYPDFPVVPGVILCEAAMQAGAILLARHAAGLPGRIPVATRMGDVRFKQMIRADDTIHIEVELTERLADAFFMKAKVSAAGKTAVRLEFACALARREDAEPAEPHCTRGASREGEAPAEPHHRDGVSREGGAPAEPCREGGAQWEGEAPAEPHCGRDASREGEAPAEPHCDKIQIRAGDPDREYAAQWESEAFCEAEAPAEPAPRIARDVTLRRTPRRAPVRKHPVHGVAMEGEGPTIVFLTVCTKARQQCLATPDVHATLRTVWTEASAWLVGKYVVMPDHVHLFVAPSETSISLDNWVRYWKSQFSKEYCKWLRGNLALVTQGSKRIQWQSDHWDSRVRSSESYAEKWEYVRHNPVRKKLVSLPEEWPYQGVIHDLPW